MKDICLKFPITNEEHVELEKQFGKLVYYAAHQLKKKNSRNNFTDDIEDIRQELQFALIRAGSYYKRQIYIELCFTLVKDYAADNFMGNVVASLEDLWCNRTRHGANRQKFGSFQEQILSRIVKSIVPAHLRPNKNTPLVIDSKFATYCKAICWNAQKSLGKKITREKSIRSNLVSLSEHDYLGGR
jgi:hypothetical protein